MLMSGRIAYMAEADNVISVQFSLITRLVPHFGLIDETCQDEGDFDTSCLRSSFAIVLHVCWPDFARAAARCRS